MEIHSNGKGRRLLLGLALGTVVLGHPVLAELPPNFQNEVLIASGLTYPTALEFLPDGRMLISEFHGRLVVVQPGATSIDPVSVVQLTNVFIEEASAGGERGMVNVVAHPQFGLNGYIYLFYTADNPQRDRVSRFTMSGNTASLASELVIWQGVEDSDRDSHHGGGMLFDSEGKLFISTGDNTDAASSPALNSDKGKLMRFNADGTIPADNPFVDGAGPNIDAIWARGLRNPFRLHQDTATGRMYIGDVGLFTNEEINVAVKGANYGWPNSEGPSGASGVTNPIHYYSHNGADASVTGGLIYRGNQFPAAYQGVYFYADYAQNWIRYLTLNAGGSVTGDVAFQPVDGSHDTPEVGDPVCFKLGPDGSLYYVDFGWSPAQNPATIRRIRYTAANQPPVVVVAATPVSGPTPLAVGFSSAGSSDPEGQALSYQWTFGDGATSTAANPVHVYQQDGLFTARLALSDGANTTVSDVLIIAAGNAPTGTLTSPAGGLPFRAGDVIGFSATATDPEDGALGASAYSWTILFHHDTHVHPTLGPLSGVTSGTYVIPTSGHDFSGETKYEIVLTVTDSDGLPHRSSVFINPQKVNLSFQSLPTGLTLRLDGVDRTTPFVKDTLVGFQHTLAAPDQAQGATLLDFLSWSDGGGQTHPIAVPSGPATYTATFEVVPPLLPDGLVLAYGFEEGGGTTAADGSGNDRAGTLVNGPAWSAGGKYGGGVVLDGADDFIRVPTPGLPTGDSTYTCWLNLDSYTNFQSIVSVNGGQPGLEINLVTDRVDVVSNGALALTTEEPFPLGVWTHLAVVRSGNTWRVYVNGAPDGASGATSGAQDLGTCALLIGADADSGCQGALNGYLDGRLDEFRVYGRALSGPEIQTDMNTPLDPGDAAQTYGNWSDEQGFASPQDAQPSADPNANGFTNLADYAFGVDPVAPGPGPEISTTLLPQGSETYVALTYRRPGGPTQRSDVTYLCQQSEDLDAWTGTGLVEQVGPVAPDGKETVTVRTTVPLRLDGRRFLRLSLALDP